MLHELWTRARKCNNVRGVSQTGSQRISSSRRSKIKFAGNVYVIAFPTSYVLATDPKGMGVRAKVPYQNLSTEAYVKTKLSRSLETNVFG